MTSRRFAMRTRVKFAVSDEMREEFGIQQRAQLSDETAAGQSRPKDGRSAQPTTDRTLAAARADLIIAVDPGQDTTGLAYAKRDPLTGVIFHVDEAVPNDKVIDIIGGGSLLHVVCEDVEFQDRHRVGKPLIDTAKMIGRIYQAVISIHPLQRPQFHLVQRSSACNWLMGQYPRVRSEVKSPESRVRRAVDARLAEIGWPPIDKPGNHGRSAVAVLLYWLHKQETKHHQR